MPQQLTALDGMFLELEDADPAAHMHIGAVFVFEPRPSRRPPALETVVAQIAARVDALPRYRQRLAAPDAGRMTWQCWEDDPHFDVRRHVRRAALPKPGGDDELREWAADEFSRRLDRDRPLWEIVLVTGLSGGRWALLSKTHHCLVDGVGSVDASFLLLDDERIPTHPPQFAPASTGEPALPPPLRGPADTVRASLHAATRPRETLARAWALAGLVVREELRAAPASSLNRPIGPRRRLRTVTADLAEVREIGATLGGTVNDVVLAAVCGGLRALLLERGETPPAAGLRAMVPMNVRTPTADGLGNRVTSLFVDLPVAEPDPGARYARIAETTADLKRSSARMGADAMLSAGERLPPVVHQLAANARFARRLFNVTITNVPGPQQPLYGFGAQMLAAWPLVPLAADHAVGVAIFSYDGTLTFGINADADSVPDIDVLAGAIAGELRVLSALRGAAAAAAPRAATAPTRSP